MSSTQTAPLRTAPAVSPRAWHQAARWARPALLACFVSAAAFGSMGCENRAIGRTCSTLVDAGDMQAIFNDEALECPTRLCVKPAKSAVTSTDTKAFCTAECNKSSDCDDHETRDPDPKNTLDKRCKKGFTCGVAFEVGPFACQKMCLCKDFLADDFEDPASCSAKN